MRKLLRWILGTAELELVSADISGMLESLAVYGVRFWDLRVLDSVTAVFTVYTFRTGRLLRLMQRQGNGCRILARHGLPNAVHQMRGRLPLLLLMTAAAAAFLYMTKLVLFVEVAGNQNVASENILRAAECAGIRFWAEADKIQNEPVKNRMLEQIPELQWVGVTFHGCVATVTVRERRPDAGPSREDAISDVVAACDGIITQVSILEGETRCHVGQAVRKGELLAAGCIEHEYHPQYSHAEAEVYALTQHPCTAVCPNTIAQKEPAGEKYRRVCLLVGRKRINLFGNSGIPMGTCDKMYSQNYLVLPGGYQLPLALEVETSTDWTTKTVSIPEERAGEALSRAAEQAVMHQMLAGEILGGQPELIQDGDLFCYTINYTCREMIARQRILNLFEGEHTDDGTNH